MSNAYRINALTQAQLDAAYEQARTRIAGPQPEPQAEPDKRAFLAQAISRYPRWLSILIYSLCALMLVVAFLPSAMRLYHIGQATVGQTFTDNASVVVAAICIVLMAEVGQIIFSLALAVTVVRWQVVALIVGAFICTLIALTGNAAAVYGSASLINPDDPPPTPAGEVFKFLETFAPPILVLITAQILKTQLLHAIQDKYAAEQQHAERVEAMRRQYAEAEKQWREAVASAHLTSDWDRTLAVAIFDALRSANAGSKAIIRELSSEERRWLVTRERSGAEWWDASALQVSFAQPSEGVPLLSAVRPQADNGQHGYGSGYVRAADARTQVREYLDANPDAAALTVRDLASAIGVGKTVTSEVLREWKAQR